MREREIRESHPARSRHESQVKPKNRIAAIMVNVFFGLCLLALIGAVVLIVAARKSGDGIAVFGFRPFMVATGSMEPTFQVNGLVVARDGGFDDIKVGDIVAFRAEGMQGQTALHRVIKIVDDNDKYEGRIFVVKGDNNMQADGAPVTRDNYLGKVVWNTNFTKAYADALNQPGGWVRAIALPILALLLVFIAMRCLIGASMSWQGKGLAISAAVLLVSSASLLAYAAFTIRKVDHTNEALAKVANDFSEKCKLGETWKIAGRPVIGRIEIPEIDLDYPVIAYSGASSLDVAITHFTGAKINTTGNSVLAGRRVYGDTSLLNLFFTRIDRLGVGDDVYLTSPDCERVKYTVTDHKAVKSPDDSMLMQPKDGKRYTTLISGSYDMLNRYIVRAEAVQN